MEIRPLANHDEYRAVERLQADVWNLADVEVVPLHILITAAKNGGLLLGAFEGVTLLGFAFGFPGLTAEGRVKHCSHMAGVHPDYRDRNLGYRLKLAQRQAVLAQGMDLITWTFDPLEARNAWLNFHKLGAICNTYLRNVYGDMRDGLNTGLPSDRFQVDWWIRSDHVVRRLRGEGGQRPSIGLIQGGSSGYDAHPSGPPSPEPSHRVREGSVVAAIPANIQALKAADMARALHWRMETRRTFEDAFARGYQVTGVIRQDDQLRYLLELTAPAP